MRCAATTLAEREAPRSQCTSNRPPLASASSMNGNASCMTGVRLAVSSSAMRHSLCTTLPGDGIRRSSKLRTCVMRKSASAVELVHTADPKKSLPGSISFGYGGMSLMEHPRRNGYSAANLSRSTVSTLLHNPFPSRYSSLTHAARAQLLSQSSSATAALSGVNSSIAQSLAAAAASARGSDASTQTAPGRRGAWRAHTSRTRMLSLTKRL
mmetsp:Transcript_30647/g.79597  ORF Transcript_30647/g.79597 Transcript_30647/m.79597 type:complete len:211 (-) Transcript_30647:69-701(-)